MPNYKFFFLSFFIILFVSCINSNRSATNENKSIQTDKLKVDSLSVKKDSVLSEEFYTDSIIHDIISNSLPKSKILLDSTIVLNGIICKKVNKINYYQFTNDTIVKYENKLFPLDKSVKEILQVTNCFSNLLQTDEFKAYIFFSQINESHYSSSFELITIQEKTNVINKIILTQEYGNELEDQYITTRMIDDLHFIRIINSNIRYIHGVGEVDSSSLRKEYYTISKSGEFNLIDSVIEM